MPKFEPDFENVRATTRIFDKGDYEVKFNAVTGFVRFNKKGDLTYGATLFCKMEGKVNSKGQLTDEFNGEDVSPIQLWIHNDGSLRATKRVLMAVFGYSKDEEEEFNRWYKTQDFSVSGEENDDGKYENIEIGDAWKDVVGKHARVRMDKGTYTPDDGGETVEQQKFNVWTPANQAASV